MIGAVGSDSFAEEALAGLREAGVQLQLQESEGPTGIAVILVDADGETQIVVAPGANADVGAVTLPEHDAVLCQLEVPDVAVESAWEAATGVFCLNAAPARPIAVDPDLTVVNRYELEELSRRDGLVAVTLGAEGALLLEDGEEVARADAADGGCGRRHGRGRRVHGLPPRLAAGGTRVRRRPAASMCGGRARGLAPRCAAVAAHGGGDRRAPQRLSASSSATSRFGATIR